MSLSKPRGIHTPADIVAARRALREALRYAGQESARDKQYWRADELAKCANAILASVTILQEKGDI